MGRGLEPNTSFEILHVSSRLTRTKRRCVRATRNELAQCLAITRETARLCERMTVMAINLPTDPAADEARFPRVLIVDDNAAIRTKLKGLLTVPPLSAIVMEAENGVVALKMVMGEMFDCVICDVEMPVMHGLAFLRAVRTQRSRLELPVLLLTAKDSVAERVQGFNLGASDFLGKPFEPMELLARVETHVSLSQMHRKLQHAADTDWLTSLPNRGAFMRALTGELSRAARLKKQTSLLLMDVDHFKKVNDTHGHPIGDLVLQDIGRAIKANQRPYDMLGRLGGEEFAVILPEVGELDALIVAERLRSSIARAALGGLAIGDVTISIGVVGDEGGGTLDDIYKRADERLYDAKKLGRNRVVGSRS